MMSGKPMKLEPAPPDEYFLDSSVVRPMLLATQVYQQYFEAQFSDRPRYISRYVQMEMHRSYLRNVIEFYFILQLPSIATMGDALALWSNRYQISKQKAIQQLMAQILNRGFDHSIFQDKTAALLAIETLIREFVAALQTQFMFVDLDATQCARTFVPFADASADFLEAIAQFTKAFDQVATCRSQCRIDQFILVDHRIAVEAYIQQAANLPENAKTRGFIRTAQSLKKILEQGAKACSCKQCERIGDAVIALDAPRQMRLEHTDQAFDHLCPPIAQPHCQHPSEVQVLSRNSS